MLDLRGNKISEIDWRNLPPTLTTLHLENNQLSTVGDISHCTEMLSLYLHDNTNLHSIHGLPNTKIFVSTGVSVKVLGQKCFHKHTCSMLTNRCQLLKWKLEQPPVEVLLQGLEAVLEYYKENSVRTTQTR